MIFLIWCAQNKKFVFSDDFSKSDLLLEALIYFVASTYKNKKKWN